VSNTVNNEELALFEKGMTKCLNCTKWYDTSDMEPLSEFNCQSCDSVVLTPYRISEYWLYDLIGEGGMGYVYLAQQPGDLNLYAIKIAAIEGDHEDNDFRFESLLYEGEIYIEMDHPNIPKAHNFGYKHGVAFLIMDYEFGYQLDEYLVQEGVFPIARKTIASWMSQLVSALQYMKNKDYIYRDLKPQNILIDGEYAILTDLGLCMHMDHHKDIDEANLVGSPAYLPPERVAATPEDFRSDMYSLGMLFFFIINGSNFFDGESHEEIVEMHMTPERESVISINPTICPEFAAILDKLISYSPDERYQSYEELSADIDALVLTLTATDKKSTAAKP
jgi:serine/threonine protein kinase